MRHTRLSLFALIALAGCEAATDVTDTSALDVDAPRSGVVLQGIVQELTNPAHTEVVLLWQMPIDTVQVTPESIASASLDDVTTGAFRLPMLSPPPALAFHRPWSTEPRAAIAQAKIFLCAPGTAAIAAETMAMHILDDCSATLDGDIIYADADTALPLFDGEHPDTWSRDDVLPAGFHALIVNRDVLAAERACNACVGGCNDEACATACGASESHGVQFCRDGAFHSEGAVDSLVLYPMGEGGFPVVP
jgi:hypothetical protein